MGLRSLSDLRPTKGRDALLSDLARYFKQRQLGVDWEALKAAEDEMMINALSMRTLPVGISLFHAVTNDLHDLDDLQVYSMLASKDAAGNSFVVKTKTGEIFLGAGNNKAFAKFAEVLGMPEMARDARFKDNGDRLTNRVASIVAAMIIAAAYAIEQGLTG